MPHIFDYCPLCSNTRTVLGESFRPFYVKHFDLVLKILLRDLCGLLLFQRFIYLFIDPHEPSQLASPKDFGWAKRTNYFSLYSSACFIHINLALYFYIFFCLIYLPCFLLVDNLLLAYFILLYILLLTYFIPILLYIEKWLWESNHCLRFIRWICFVMSDGGLDQ